MQIKEGKEEILYQSQTPQKREMELCYNLFHKPNRLTKI